MPHNGPYDKLARRAAWRDLEPPTCPSCGGPALEADPRYVKPPTEACADPECRGAHGWVFEPGRGPVPWAERTAALGSKTPPNPAA